MTLLFFVLNIRQGCEKFKGWLEQDQLLSCCAALDKGLLRYAPRRDHNLKSVRQLYLFLAQCLDTLHNLLQTNA